MKHVKFYQSPNWSKWGLAGCLIVVLGANLSFNPDSKTIARHQSLQAGVFSLATTTPSAENKTKPDAQTDSVEKTKSTEKTTQNKNQDEIELKDQYKGLKVKVQYSENKDKARFIIEKSGTTEAGICVSCVEKLGPETVTIDELDRNNLDLTRRAIMTAAINQLDTKLKKEKDNNTSKVKKQKEDTSLFATFDMEKYRCEKPDEVTDATEVAEYKTCLSENLKELKDDCKQEAKDKYETEKTAAGENREQRLKIKKDTASCEKLARKYYSEEIKPAVRMTKRIQLDQALQTYQTIYDRTFNEALQVGMSSAKADEMAKTRAKLAVTQTFPNLVNRDLSVAVPGSLASLHRQVSAYTNQDPQYQQIFQTEYATPMTSIMTSLTSPSTAANNVDVAQMLRNAMNVESIFSNPNNTNIQPMGQRPSVNGSTNFPGRPAIGNPPRAHSQIRSNQQFVPNAQMQNLPRQSGAQLPGPRMGQ